MNKVQKTFLDRVRVFAKGGTGGNGLPKYGGVGGKGGDVYVEAHENYSLHKLKAQFPKKRFIAGQGENSCRHRILGNPGKDVVIKCPVGVSAVTDANRNIGDLNQVGDRVLVARGGCGGGPENDYIGQKGQSLSVSLDLKLLADVGLVGFPNAGKSTLLKALSRASPKIASYPFTTIRPNIGTIVYNDLRNISVADLPGLIEGAHMNYGMGHHFLKHCVRTKLLLFVVDITGFRLSVNHVHRSAFETVMLLNRELELYDPELCLKPAILAVNKVDLDETSASFDQLLSSIKNVKDNVQDLPNEMRPDNVMRFDAVIPISAKFKRNLQNLKNKLRTIIDIRYVKGPENISTIDNQSSKGSEESVMYI